MCQEQTPEPVTPSRAPRYMVGPLTRDQLAMLQNALFSYCEDEVAMAAEEEEKGYIDQDWCDLKNIVDEGWIRPAV